MNEARTKPWFARMRSTLILFSIIAIGASPLLARASYYLQAGAFHSKQHAKAWSNTIKHLTEHPTRIRTKEDGHHKLLHLVQISDIKTKQEAQATQQHLRKNDINTRLREEKMQSANNGKLWNLRDVDIRSVIEEVGKETGKNFLIDPRVRGKITLISNSPIKSDALYQVFLTALHVSGFAAVPSGRVIKIIPDNQSRSTAAPVYGTGQAHGAKNIVRVIRVRHVSAQALVPVLRPLLPNYALLSAYPPSNSLIIAGHADNINKIAQIVRRVDTSNSQRITMIKLRHASAEDVVETLKNLIQSQGRGRLSQPVSLAADERSNAVLISGSPADRLRMKVLISQMDTANTNQTAGRTQVVYLHYLRAEDLAPVIAGIARSYYHGKVGTTVGTSTGQATVDLKQDKEQTQSAAQKQQKAKTEKGEKGRTQVEIIAEPNTNSLILTAPKALMRTLKRVIRKLDIRPAQVLVEAMIAEVNEDSVSSLGIEWGSLLPDANNSEAGPTVFSQGLGIIRIGDITRDGFESGFDSFFAEFQARITALANDNKADILSTPSVVVLDNHIAKILVGQRVSIEDSTYPNNAGGTTTGTPYTTFDREEVALHLYVRPQINQGDGVQLQIDQGNDTLATPNDQSSRPIVNTSSIKTSVLVKSGDILVLGGLKQNSLKELENKIPFLGDVPLIGHIFSKTTTGRERRSLMIFIRPVIIRNRRDSLTVSGDKYNFIRDKQLNWLRQRRVRGSHEYLLPDFKEIKLPKPFQGHHR